MTQIHRLPHRRRDLLADAVSVYRGAGDQRLRAELLQQPADQVGYRRRRQDHLARGHLGLLLAELGRTGEAIDHLTRAAALRPDAMATLNNLGYALGAKLNRWLEYTGLELTNADYFAFAGLVMIVPMLLLLTLDPDGVAARKRAEEAALAGAA